MNILELSKSSSAKTEFSFFSVFFSSVFVFFRFFSIPTSVSVSVFLKYRDIGFGFRLPTRLYHNHHNRLCPVNSNVTSLEIDQYMKQMMCSFVCSDVKKSLSDSAINLF